MPGTKIFKAKYFLEIWIEIGSLDFWTEFTNTLRAEQLMKFVNKFIVSTLLKREVQKPLKDFKLYAKISGFFTDFLWDFSSKFKGKIQSSEQGPTLRLAIIYTGYIKKPNFVRLWQLQSNDAIFYEPVWLFLTKG